ncbi:MAG: type III pantothenate kinase [Eubacteriales bacterium]|nr:type III pantothenate kinase [Eubacteriales bacterium]
MILALDVGNTNIVVGCIENGEIRNIFRIRTDVNQTYIEYAVKLREIFEILKVDTDAFEGAIVSCVVPPVTKSLTDAVKLLTGLDCKVVGPGMKTGLNVCIDDPGTLAADLAVGAVAAINCYGSPCIIVDMGTATTITVVDGKNRFLGGAIMPGVNLSYSALSSGTSLLPHISIVPPPKAVGSNTIDCMRSGAVFGNAAMIDGMIDRMEEELGVKCNLVVTGGLASSVTKYCRHELICDDDLLLKGLWILYNKNK